MKKIPVLFVCIHNSARSQMAEAWLNHLCGETFHAESAGLEPGKLNPIVVQAMGEVGIDISHKVPQAVFDLVRAGRTYRYVIAVCDQEAAEKCPIFPGVCTRLHWAFPDPSRISGTDEEKLAGTREIRDAIHEKIAEWCEQVCPAGEFVGR
jgi:arsenate reductase (thioredoxin)